MAVGKVSQYNVIELALMAGINFEASRPQVDSTSVFRWSHDELDLGVSQDFPRLADAAEDGLRVVKAERDAIAVQQQASLFADQCEAIATLVDGEELTIMDDKVVLLLERVNFAELGDLLRKVAFKN